MVDKPVAVILAAGNAKRMYPLNEETSKTVFPVLNKPIMEYHIELLKKSGINEILIVVGANGFKISEIFGDGSKYGVSIKYIEQKEKLGIAHAVGIIEKYVDGSFLLILGDIFFVIENLKDMINTFYSQKLDCVLMSKKDIPQNIMKNFSIIEGENGLVKHVIEKPRYVNNNLKGCGVYLFNQHIFDAIRRTPRTAQRDEYEITDSIQILINYGYKVKAVDHVVEDMNLTSPEDFLKINLEELKRLKMENVIGENVKINPNAKLVNCIVGNGAVISESITLKNCLILSNTVVKSRVDLEYSIITPTHELDCHSHFKRG